MAEGQMTPDELARLEDEAAPDKKDDDVALPASEADWLRSEDTSHEPAPVVPPVPD